MEQESRNHPNGSWPHTGDLTQEPPAKSLGIPAWSTHEALQQDACVELANKLAWALGSTYRMPYSSKATLARQYAWTLMQETVIEHGYPSKISK